MHTLLYCWIYCWYTNAWHNHVHAHFKNADMLHLHTSNLVRAQLMSEHGHHHVLGTQPCKQLHGSGIEGEQ